MRPAIQCVALYADAVTGRATPFLAHFDAWKPSAGLKPRPLDQASSTVKQFAREVNQTLQSLQPRHVQAWIDAQLRNDGNGTSAKTEIGRASCRERV